ncbi:MAG: hypothetical protein U0586_07945 [Candidatus Brocadiaceae bacterium]
MKGCLKNICNHCLIFQHFLYALTVSFLLSVTFLMVISSSVSFAGTSCTVKVQDISQTNLVDSKIQLFDTMKPEFITLTSEKKQNNNDKKESGIGNERHGHGHGHGHGDDDDDDDDNDDDHHHTTTTTTSTTSTTSTTTTTCRPVS